jgi:hypothetical protein
MCIRSFRELPVVVTNTSLTGWRAKLLLILSRKRESGAMRKLSSPADWRRAMRSQVVWVLLAKLAVLTLLWFLFFSPAQRQRVDGAATSSHFALEGDRS